MDNLGELLAPILSDPEMMKQVAEMAEKLGLGGAAEEKTNEDTKSAALSAGNTPDAAGIAGKLIPLLGQLDKEDDAARLLRALRPYLGENRRRKADEAEKLLSLLRVVRAIKEQKLF